MDVHKLASQVGAIGRTIADGLHIIICCDAADRHQGRILELAPAVGSDYRIADLVARGSDAADAAPNTSMAVRVGPVQSGGMRSRDQQSLITQLRRVPPRRGKGYKGMREFAVRTFCDDDAHVWVGEGDELPLASEADTLDRLLDRATAIAPLIAYEKGLIKKGDHVTPQSTLSPIANLRRAGGRSFDREVIRLLLRTHDAVSCALAKAAIRSGIVPSRSAASQSSLASRAVTRQTPSLCERACPVEKRPGQSYNFPRRGAFFYLS